PLKNNEEYPFDLQQIAIQIIGENDGSFDNQDYILFYAEGVDTYNLESDTHLNIYSDRSYYYITASGFENGKRISEIVEPTQAPTLTVSEFDDYQFHERDLYNFTYYGRKWFGEQFIIQNEQTFQFDFPNLVTSVPVKARVVTAINKDLSASFTLKANNTEFGTISSSTPPISNNDILGKEKALNTTFNTTSSSVAITITYSNNGVPTLNGYLDYIALTARRQLKGTGKQFQFRYDEAASHTGVIEYQLSNMNSVTQIWDVTDIYNITKKENSGNSAMNLKAFMGELRKYVVVEPSDYYTPSREQSPRVINQNLKGTVLKNNQGVFTDIDYPIITPAFLNTQAEKLADFHRNNSGLVVKVVNLENIYHEFSSGKQDIGAIKNFVRYVYHNASSPEKRVKYLN